MVSMTLFDDPTSLSILVPVYNEERTVVELLRRVATRVGTDDLEKEIVVIDDGSTDGSRAALERLERDGLPGVDLVVLHHDRNRGKGAAIRTALDMASGDLVVVQDADLEYDPRDIGAMVKRLRADDLPVLYGSRRLGDNRRHASWASYLGGRALTAITNLLYPLSLTDEPTCYKLFRRDVIVDLDLACERFEFCPEVTAKLGRLGVDIPEVPISYDPRGVADGKKIGARDFVEAVAVLVRERFRTTPDRPRPWETGRAAIPRGHVAVERVAGVPRGASPPVSDRRSSTTRG